MIPFPKATDHDHAPYDGIIGVCRWCGCRLVNPISDMQHLPGCPHYEEPEPPAIPQDVIDRIKEKCNDTD